MSGATPAGKPLAEDLPVVRRVVDLRAAVRHWRVAGESVGLVPTMGGLHAGHLALVRAASGQCRRTVVSLFVNPTQFGPKEDFAAYPRDERKDRVLLAGVGADLLYAPPVEEMYPSSFSTQITVGRIAEPLCGPFRPGHFAGVATVVCKLLDQAQPDSAYFGEKDYQQLQVIRTLVRDLDLPVRVVGVATVRDSDGLALSSRNAYLSPEERQVAPRLYRVLTAAALQLHRGEPPDEVVASGARSLGEAGFKTDYFAFRNSVTLAPVTDRRTEPLRLLAAAWLGKTRLIDNIAVKSPA